VADQAIFRINVGGVDVTERINAVLESLLVTDKAGTTSDTATITLDDSDGRLIMPSVGSPLLIDLGWRTQGLGRVFEGTVDDVRSNGSRGGGRTLRISGKGFDTKGKAKEPLEFHKDDATLQQFMGEAAAKAGLSFQAQGDIGSIKREYWSAGTESFVHLGHRIAREVGATFKIVGAKGIMVPRNGGMSASGGSLATVTATWGLNLINWDISPILSRPRFKEARARWFDRQKANWMEEVVGIETPGASSPAQHTNRYTRADSDEAKKSGTNNKRGSEREAGNGSVTILGEPAAQPEGTCIIVGARAGVDGPYRIDSVTHDLSRGGGFHTKLGLKQPQGSAGSDSRGKK
jgi:phage protein D